MKNIRKFDNFAKLNEDEQLNEDYPAIFKTLDKSHRNHLAAAYGVGQNSEITEIPKTEATKKSAAGKLLAYVKNDTLLGYGIETMVQPAGRLRRGESAPTRKALIDMADKIYVIGKDAGVRSKRDDRYSARSGGEDETVKKGFNKRANDLIDQYKDKLNDRLAALKAEYLNLVTTAIDSIEDRANKGDIYGKNDIYSSDDKRKLDDLAAKIAKIGHVMWSKKSWTGYINDADGIARMSKDIQDALK